MQMAGLLKATVYMKPNHSSIVSIICGEDILFKALFITFSWADMADFQGQNDH